MSLFLFHLAEWREGDLSPKEFTVRSKVEAIWPNPKHSPFIYQVSSSGGQEGVGAGCWDPAKLHCGRMRQSGRGRKRQERRDSHCC